jgi:hypothetical protein
MEDKPVGQWLANMRKSADRQPAERLAKLAAIDEDWNPGWPMDWQRSYAALAQLVQAGTAWGEIEPGTGLHGMDVGRWLHRQRQHVVWHGLMDGQRQRLQALGVTPLPAEEQEAPSKAPRAASGAFERGVAALGRSTRPAQVL